MFDVQQPRQKAQAVLSLDSRDIEALPTLEAAILAAPHERMLAEHAFDYVRDCLSHEDAVDWLVAVQERSAIPLKGVIKTLGSKSILRSDGVRHRLAGKFSACADVAPVLQYRCIWSAFMNGVEPDKADIDIIRADTVWDDELFFQFAVEPTWQLPVMSADPKYDEALTAIGVQVQVFRSFVRDFCQVYSTQWGRLLAESAVEGDKSRQACERAEAECGYLDQVVATGGLEMMDPLTGDILQVIDSFIAFGRAAYSFRGKELYVLVCSKPWFGALGLYIPRLNIAIPFGDRASNFLGGDSLTIANFLFRRVLNRPSIIRQSPVPVGAGRARIVLQVGAVENPFHHVWNFYSAIERLIAGGNLDKVSKIVWPGSEFFGALDHIFPEIRSVPFERPVRKRNVIDPSPYDPSTLVVPTGGYFVPVRLSKRIIAACHSLPRGRPNAIEPADFAGESIGPVVWMGLRLRDKAWEDQEAGAVKVIDRMLAQFPRAMFLLDGYSYPVGVDNISREWTDIITSLHQMAERIKMASSAPDQVVNMVGNTMREAVLWADKTNVYLAPYGSCQHKVGWFSSAPGVVYVPPAFKPIHVARSPGSSVAEISSPPHYIFASAASPGERRGTNRARERFSNVSLDPIMISTLLAEKLGPWAEANWHLL